MKLRAAAAAAALVASLPLAGCITYPPGWDPARGPDPYERVNRPIFTFNHGVDRFVLGPVASGWTFVTHEQIRLAVGRFFFNLRFPGRFLANLGQGEVVQAGSEIARFVVNSTVGLAGFFDPATRIGLGKYDEDFGQMFGAWGVGAGPYWVVPLIGPSNPRDFVGFVFDTVLDLRILVTGLGVVAVVNDRALNDQQIRLAREAALDYYVFVRNAFIQRRQALVENREVPPEVEPGDPDALYELEDDTYEPEHEASEGGTPHGAP